VDRFGERELDQMAVGAKGCGKTSRFLEPKVRESRHSGGGNRLTPWIEHRLGGDAGVIPPSIQTTMNTLATRLFLVALPGIARTGVDQSSILESHQYDTPNGQATARNEDREDEQHAHTDVNVGVPRWVRKNE
jgi:hypothetical protein